MEIPAANSDETELVIQIVVGMPDEVRAGRGETAVTATHAAYRLRISSARFSQLVQAGRIRAVAHIGGMALFLEREVERLLIERQDSIRRPARAP